MILRGHGDSRFSLPTSSCTLESNHTLRNDFAHGDSRYSLPFPFLRRLPKIEPHAESLRLRLGGLGLLLAALRLPPPAAQSAQAREKPPGAALQAGGEPQMAQELCIFWVAFVGRPRKMAGFHGVCVCFLFISYWGPSKMAVFLLFFVAKLIFQDSQCLPTSAFSCGRIGTLLFNAIEQQLGVAIFRGTPYMGSGRPIFCLAVCVFFGRAMSRGLQLNRANRS